MARTVQPEKRQLAVELMLDQNYGQREIHRITGLSRPYLRRLAEEVGYQFPRNGIEVLGVLCMCSNCGAFFRRSKSKLKESKRHFCSDLCRVAYTKGANHPAWKEGKTASTFSTWIKNQPEYKKWREDVLEMYEHKCAITGREDNLDIHHILPKSENQEYSLDVHNGIPLNKEVHQEVHKLMSEEGLSFDEASAAIRRRMQE